MSTRQFIPAGTNTVTTPVIVGSGDLLYGSSGFGSTLKRHSSFLATANWPGLVSSRNYQALSATNYFYQNEGAIVRPTLRELVVNGGADLGAVRADNLGRPRLLDGINLLATAPQINNVCVFDIAGYGIYLTSGDESHSNPGHSQERDSTKCLVANSLIRDTFTGVAVQHNEAFIKGNEIVAYRDVGLHFLAVGAQASDNHVFGGDIGTQIGTPTAGFANAIANHQSADSRINFLCYGPGTQCSGYLRLYGASETSLETYASIDVAQLYCNVPTGTTGVKLHTGAEASSFQGKLVLAGTGVGYEFAAGGAISYTRITNSYIYGGAKAILVNNAINYSLLANVQIQDSMIDIRSFGQNNIWRVYGNGTIQNNTGSALHVSNKIYINDALQSL